MIMREVALADSSAQRIFKGVRRSSPRDVDDQLIWQQSVAPRTMTPPIFRMAGRSDDGWVYESA
jgi:hypothetical protein